MNDLNLDSVAFDPRRYISNFLRNNTIKDLIKKNNEIEQEIKVHDHEIQSLVFENYSKFISSIDTVKQMKTDISRVDDKLRNLDQSMDKIAELALKIDGTFSVKRKEIQKLDTINKDLQKLKNLCEFPEVLKSDLQFYKSLQKSDDKPYQQLFEKSASYYRECFATLNEFRTEQLIAPIYKESINKVEEVRSILWSLQNQLKARNNRDLKSITKKFVSMTEDQISPLRTYFKKIKEKLGENCLANEKTLPVDDFRQEEEVDLQTVRTINSETLQRVREQPRSYLNEQYWSEFEEDFRFLVQDLIPILKRTEQIDQLLVNSQRESFAFVLNNFYDAVNKNCQSSVYFVVLLQRATNYFRRVVQTVQQEPLKKQFDKLLSDKMEQLCVMHVGGSFTRLKMSLLNKYVQQKEQLIAMKITEQVQKEVFNIINPLKAVLSGGFLRLLVGLQNIPESSFIERKKLVELLLGQLGDLVKLLCYLLSTSSSRVSEEAYQLLGYSKQLATQRKVIEQAVVKLRHTADNGLVYLLNHSLLQIFHKSLWQKLLSDFLSVYGITEQNLTKDSQQRLTQLTDLCKKSLSKNLCDFSTFYVNRISQIYDQPEREGLTFSDAVLVIEELVEITSYIFPESRRVVPKKPSLLNNNDRSYSIETEVMLAKKAHWFDKREQLTKSIILSTFTKGVLKNWLRLVRLGRYSSSKFESEVYCLVQLCYEITSVDEESLVSAFFYLLRAEYYRSDNVKVDKTALDAVYSAQRGKAKI